MPGSTEREHVANSHFLNPVQYNAQSKPDMLTSTEKRQELFLNYSTQHPLFPVQRSDNFVKAFHSKTVAHLGVPVTEQTPSNS